MRNYVKTHSKKEVNIEVLPNFTNPVLLRKSISGVKKQYYLYMGRLSREKGIMTMLNAAAQSGIELVIAGTGPLEKEVKEYIARTHSGNIKVVGFVEGNQKMDLFAGAKALIVPSEWYEQLPTNVIEAFSIGIPVIASDTGGLGSMVEHGVNGLKFKPGDSEEMTNAIRMMENMNDDQYAHMCGKAKNSWESRYSPQVFKSKILSLYKDAVKNRKLLRENNTVS